MNYIKIYNNLIAKAKLREAINGYKETHHILPKSLGGTDTKENLVAVTAREHFICHLLLTKMYREGSLEWIKMMKAFNMMLLANERYQTRYINSHLYSYLRVKFAKAQSLSQSGINNSQFNTMWVYNKNIRTAKKIKRTQLESYLSSGWEIGRVINWNSWDRRNESKQIKEKTKQIKAKTKKVNIEKLNSQKTLYKEYYKIYNELGWDEFVSQTKWPYSKSYLVMKFASLLDEFIPQNGKKRGKKQSSVV